MLKDCLIVFLHYIFKHWSHLALADCLNRFFRCLRSVIQLLELISLSLSSILHGLPSFLVNFLSQGFCLVNIYHKRGSGKSQQFHVWKSLKYLFPVTHVALLCSQWRLCSTNLTRSVTICTHKLYMHTHMCTCMYTHKHVLFTRTTMLWPDENSVWQAHFQLL